MTPPPSRLRGDEPWRPVARLPFAPLPRGDFGSLDSTDGRFSTTSVAEEASASVLTFMPLTVQ